METVPGVNFVLITWTAPGGQEIINNNRVIIHPTNSNGNNYTSILQFTYLMEGDEGNYTCNWMILETSGSQSVVLQLISKFLNNCVFHKFSLLNYVQYNNYYSIT